MFCFWPLISAGLAIIILITMINHELGEAVRAARKAQGLTQAGLRDLSDVSLSSIHKIENGREDLSLTSVLAVTEALGMRLVCKSPLGEEIDLNG